MKLLWYVWALGEAVSST